MDWLFRSNFDTATTLALWSIAAVTATTIVLFVYTMGLRVATILANRNRRRFLDTWRGIFASSVISDDASRTAELPLIRNNERTNLLEEWNRARSIVDGRAVENLIALAERINIPRAASTLLARRRVQSRILAVQTIGHLRDASHKEAIRDLIRHENTALSITAAEALVEIDPAGGISTVIPMIESRRDWPKNRVSVMLRNAGSELISEPMYRAIRSADEGGQTYMLQFARLVESEVLDALVAELLQSSSHPGVLNAALKLVSGFAGVPRIAWLSQHKAWFVRMQAAKVLGRIGQPEHLSLLESLLDDPEWWVRYRAAQSIVSLPFLGPNKLRQLQQSQSDPFAADILQQAFAEVGLA